MSLSYDVVADAARTLEAEGKPVGARSLHAILGTGSLTTIQKHLLRWREERSRTSPPDLPESLHRGILAFAEQAAKQEQVRLDALLESIRTGEEQEHRLEVLQEDLSERDERVRQTTDQIRHLEVRLGECQERERREREEAHALREDLVKAELRLEELPRLREETKSLRASLVEEKEARVAAEKESAVSRALLAEKATSHKPPSGRA